jgi:arsenical pump membrane protein
VRRSLLLVGVLAAGGAAVAVPHATSVAAGRTWPPFVLVIGLLLVGLVAHADNLFERAAALTTRLRGDAVVLFLVLLGLVAAVAALLNLDTAAAFLTPILVLSARRRSLPEAPFLFGSLFMANAASLLLPGSNLTNLLVLAHEHVSGSRFAARMLPAWGAAVLVTALVLLVRYRRDLSSPSGGPSGAPSDGEGSLGWVATVAAAVLMLALRSAAVPVLATGLTAVGVRMGQRRLRLVDITAAVDIAVLGGLFCLAVALGALAGSWHGPGDLVASAGRWESAALGAVGAVLVNNLPAAVLLSARSPAHPRALLIGLDLGPNLAVTGSLSALLWLQAARSIGTRPSLLAVTRIGIVLVPCSVVAAVASAALLTSHHP